MRDKQTDRRREAREKRGLREEQEAGEEKRQEKKEEIKRELFIYIWLLGFFCFVCDKQTLYVEQASLEFT